MKKMMLIFVLALVAMSGSLRAGLVNQWNFDGDLTDSVGGNHGVAVNYSGGGAGETYVKGYDGTANGAVYLATWEDWVETSSALTISGNANRTLNFWFKAPKQQMAPISTGGRTGSGTLFEVLLDVPADGAIGHYWYSDTSYGTGNNPVVTWDDWEMLTLTYDNTTNENKIYHNGVLKKTLTMTLNTTATIMNFGGGAWRDALPWYADYVGAIDEVSLYDTTLDDAAVFALVPEPMTLGLLAVGGLLIRRRRKA